MTAAVCAACGQPAPDAAAATAETESPTSVMNRLIRRGAAPPATVAQMGAIPRPDTAGDRLMPPGGDAA